MRLARSLALATLLLGSLPACMDNTSPSNQTQDVTQSTGRFELFVGEDGQRYFQLLAKNGQRLVRSEGYASLTSAKSGITSVKKNGLTEARYVVLTADDGRAYFNLKAANGQVIATSDTYATTDGAKQGIAAVIAALAKPSTADADATGPKFETFTGEDGKPHFHLRADNGQVILESQGYSSKSAATKGIDSVKFNGVTATSYRIAASDAGQYTFNLFAQNGQIIGQGEVYASKSNALRGAARVQEILRDLTGKADLTAEQILADLTKASEGIYYLSESDFPFVPVTATLGAGQTITEAVVREELASVIDADPATDKPLASLYSMSKTWQEWKDSGVNCYDPEDPVMVELCGKTRNLEQVLESDLTDLHVYYFGKKGKAGDVTGIAVSIVIVGLTPDGKLAGVRTIAIWT